MKKIPDLGDFRRNSRPFPDREKGEKIPDVFPTAGNPVIDKLRTKVTEVSSLSYANDMATPRGWGYEHGGRGERVSKYGHAVKIV